MPGFVPIDPGDLPYVLGSLRAAARREASAFGPGEVMLTSPDLPLRVRAWVDDDGIRTSGGYGGFEEVPRPHRDPIVDWKGWSARRCTAPIILHAKTLGRPDVEDMVRNLERMARTLVRGTPPGIVLNGGVVPIEARGRVWLIDNLEPGDALRNAEGARTMVRISLTLVERRGADTVSLSNTRTPKAARTHTVKRGQNLAEIATQRLGSTSRWREIADLNKALLKRLHVTGPRKNIPAGTVLRLPVDPLP